MVPLRLHVNAQLCVEHAVKMFGEAWAQEKRRRNKKENRKKFKNEKLSEFNYTSRMWVWGGWWLLETGE